MGLLLLQCQVLATTSSKYAHRDDSVVSCKRGCYYHVCLSELHDFHIAVMSAVGGLKVGVDAVEQGTINFDAVISNVFLCHFIF